MTFSVLVYLEHDRFASVDFDIGIHDQSVSLLAHFRGFNTSVASRSSATTPHPATSCSSRLFARRRFDLLNITQVCVATLGAVPVFLLARSRPQSLGWHDARVAFLLHPALQFFMSELFHPEVIAITPLLCAYYCSVRKRWGWFACFAVLAVCWKEDVALAMAILGLIIALRGDRRDRAHHRGRGARVVLRVDRGAVPAPQRRQDPERGSLRGRRRLAGRRRPHCVLASRPSRFAAGEPDPRIPRGSSSRRSASCHSRRHSSCCSVRRKRSSTSSPTCRGRRRSRSTTRRCRSRPSRSPRSRGRVRLPPDQVARRGGVLAAVVLACSMAPRWRGGRRRSATSTATASGRSPRPRSSRAARRGGECPRRRGRERDLQPRPAPRTTAPRSTRSRTRGSRRTSVSTASPGGAASVVEWIVADRRVLDEERAAAQGFVERGRSAWCSTRTTTCSDA